MAAAPAAREEGLSVIALVSGGKDSFFSILHCLANGHRVVALANLHPGTSPRAHRETSVAGASSQAADLALAPAGEGTTGGVTEFLPGGKRPGTQSHGHGHGHGQSQPGLAGGSPTGTGPGTAPESALGHDGSETDEEEDLNSFMYQTVGHQVIPLYAEATGIPLYRKTIEGGAGQHGKDYSPASSSEDETESMIPLLEAVKAAHPEANAICAGAILSTYQRTRVESVATRLGLVPLAYLWKFTTLPSPTEPGQGASAGSDTQLLDDMAAVGLEARIIKVASGGLDESFLWTNVASAAGKAKVARAMSRFGTAEKGAVIGEGGEFETLVLNGPPELFKKRIVVDENDRRVINEGGGTAWLSLRGARVEEKEEGSLGHDAAKTTSRNVRIPDLLDDRFVGVLDSLSTFNDIITQPTVEDIHVDQQQQQSGEQLLPQGDLPNLGNQQVPKDKKLQQWSFISDSSASIKEQTSSIVAQIRQRLQQNELTPSAIINSTIVLRRMADFPSINAIYGSLFSSPNPPSRVTISRGDSLLPQEARISVSLAVHANLKQPGERQGLHVQSRSYWAPANIGPYSQAISFPLGSLGSSSDNGNGPRLVSIAGQIPLVPATMALPPASSDSLGHQLVLSLQHLWRIGTDVDVRWWSSAVVYFPRQQESTRNEDDNDDVEKGAMSMPLRAKAQLAGRAWEAAHMWSEKKRDDDNSDDSDDEDDDETGPDLWDRRFNTRYMSYAAAGDGEKVKGQKLPDWAVLDEDASRVVDIGEEGDGVRSKSKKEKRRALVPPLFVAEVEELPRGAGVEWHAHMGVSGGDQDDVWVLKGEKRKNLSVYETAVGSGSSGGVRMVQTIVAEEMSKDQEVLLLSSRLDSTLSVSQSTQRASPGDLSTACKEQDQFAREAITRLGPSSGGDGINERPTIVARYVDAALYRYGQEEMVSSSIPIVPCRSLWNGTARGERLASVTLYQSVFEK